jgi:Na+-translocating ferredoxin:NAD+ oxidoreductase RnfC subunit
MDIVRMIQTAGVVGAGGAGFPTHIKLGQKAQYVLLNAAECEPLIRVDQELLSHFPVEVVTGLNYARECVSAEIAIIGIKAKHVKLIQKLIETIQNQGMESVLQVQAIKDAYPAGDEQVLVYELIGRIVPEGSIPLAVDCVVLNVETALNIYHSINKKPTTETFLTLAGDIEQPLTVKAPIGTPIQSILKLSNIEDYNQYAVIDGGPMMGNVLENLDGYISKKTKAFILLRKQSTLIRKKCMSIEQVNRINRSTCEQCRMCTDLCPRYLLGHNSTPHITMRAVNYNLDDLEAKKRSQLCCLCGLCELYSCPIGLFPKTANQVFRDTLLREGIRYQQTQESYAVRRGREYRLLPSKRLLYRLGLHKMDKAAPLMEETIKPKQVRIETSQHAGIPAVPIVSTGTQVLIGQLIAQIPDGSIGATIHASIDGIVTKVTKDYIEIKKDEV